MPAACPDFTFSVAPTFSEVAPVVKVPVLEGVLVKVLTVMVWLPVALVRINSVCGSEMPKVKPAVPVTLNSAAETVPAEAGKVTPPLLVLVPAGTKTTVPALVAEILPKFMSTFLVIEMGVTIVAVAVAVALDCAKEPRPDPIRMMKSRRIFFMVKDYLSNEETRLSTG